jgi:hypothetical protein
VISSLKNYLLFSLAAYTLGALLGQLGVRPPRLSVAATVAIPAIVFAVAFALLRFGRR